MKIQRELKKQANLVDITLNITENGEFSFYAEAVLGSIYFFKELKSVNVNYETRKEISYSEYRIIFNNLRNNHQVLQFNLSTMNPKLAFSPIDLEDSAILSKLFPTEATTNYLETFIKDNKSLKDFSLCNDWIYNSYRIGSAVTLSQSIVELFLGLFDMTKEAIHGLIEGLKTNISLKSLMIARFPIPVGNYYINKGSMSTIFGEFFNLLSQHKTHLKEVILYFIPNNIGNQKIIEQLEEDSSTIHAHPFLMEFSINIQSSNIPVTSVQKKDIKKNGKNYIYENYDL